MPVSETKHTAAPEKNPDREPTSTEEAIRAREKKNSLQDFRSTILSSESRDYRGYEEWQDHELGI